MSAELFDPAALIREAAAGDPSWDPSATPILDELLRTVALASLHSEEGRPVRFAIALRAAAPTLIVHEVQLEEPEPLTASNLKRLSAALDPEYRCFVVEPIEGGGLQIVSFAGGSPATSPVPGFKSPPLIEVDGAGRIGLRVGEKRVFFDRGDMRSEDSTTFARWVRPFTTAALDHVAQPTQMGDCIMVGDWAWSLSTSRWSDHGTRFREHAAPYAEYLVPAVLRAIAKHVQSARHGGAILVLTEDMSPKYLASSGVWFRDKGYGFVGTLVRECIGLHAHRELAAEGRWVVDGLNESFQANIDSWNKQVVDPRFERARVGLRDAIQQCAQHADIDGATILDYQLQVRGCGVKLRQPEPRDVSIPARCHEFLHTRGTRHRSMALAVAGAGAAAPFEAPWTALGIVVSQDGNAVAFHCGAGAELEHQELIL